MDAEEKALKKSTKKMSKRTTKKKLLRILPVCLLCFVLCLAGGFYLYVSDYYRAGETAAEILEDADIVMQTQWLELEAEDDEQTGLIFYPGAKVEYTAYLPLMKALQEEGMNCYLVEMPFNLAFFGKNRAEKVIAAHPEIENWYMAGHSLGGAFASAYASEHEAQISGIMLLGSYLYGSYPAEKSLTVYGSEDQVLNRDKITYDTNVYVIDGGNHALFGDYGSQKGDGEASISGEEQIRQTVSLMQEFVMESSRQG